MGGPNATIDELVQFLSELPARFPDCYRMARLAGALGLAARNGWAWELTVAGFEIVERYTQHARASSPSASCQTLRPPPPIDISIDLDEEREPSSPEISVTYEDVLDAATDRLLDASTGADTLIDADWDDVA